ncbi:MAG: hypothetical protein K2Y18_06425 [Alphaproteobacteria bacterium]|jgi:membrane protein involved in colicin uptake|nr:hypothetical protein [Alphaproteobacteria bacterium]
MMTLVTPRFQVMAICGTLLFTSQILATDLSILSPEPESLMSQQPQGSRKDTYRQRKDAAEQASQQRKDALRAQRESGDISKQEHKAAKKAEKKSLKETKKAEKKSYKQDKKAAKRAAQSNGNQNVGDNIPN